ncbi:transposase [Patescibacteria group bacterium]|nr:transposase [Patescibacteria group bacterium]MBU1721923.1 transposase [Patescibacteria group bacterium]
MPHFITLTVIEWIDIFTKEEYFKVVIDSLNYCKKNKGLKVYEYVIMTNHVHIIISTPKTNNLSQVISDFKKHTTREIWKLLEKDNRNYILNLLNNSYNKKKGYTNQIWQRENYPELIYSDTFCLTKTTYIYMNPVKKGYVKNPEDWKYSSAKNWINYDHSVIELDKKE